MESQASFSKKTLECLSNRLTPLYSKIHYKEENYLKVKTKLFIYPSPPHSKGWCVLAFLCILCTELIRSVRKYVQYVAIYVTRLPLIL